MVKSNTSKEGAFTNPFILLDIAKTKINDRQATFSSAKLSLCYSFPITYKRY